MEIEEVFLKEDEKEIKSGEIIVQSIGYGGHLKV